MASKKGIIQEVTEHSGSFALWFLLVFGATFGFLVFVGATPDKDDTQHSTATVPVVAQTPKAQEPIRIVAKDINLDTTVVNPTSTDVRVLDEALKTGAVRYPTSGLLGVSGTVLIFGHSSYLPVVYHQYYKTFDGIQNLKTGAIISIYSADKEYRYRVVGVRVADATTDAVELKSDGQYLTLVTCDSFSTKSNRFVVTAELAGE